MSGGTRDPESEFTEDFLKFFWSLVIMNEFMGFMCLEMNGFVSKGNQKGQ